MKRSIFSAMCLAVMVLLLASCGEDNERMTSVANDRVTFKGVAESISDGMRAYNKYSYDVLWNENDKIYVTDNNGKDNTFTLTSGKNTPIGTFSEDEPAKGITGNIEAFYPADLHKKDGDYYEWPAVQANNQVAPMYAKQKISGTGEETVNFSSLGAVLQIVFNSTTPDITVTSITIKDAAKPLSGKFTVDENGQAVIDKDEENVGITLDLGTGVQMGKSSKYFYITIPAGDYKGDEMTLTFTDSKSGVQCVMKSTAFPNVARNTVGRITLSGSFKNKVPTGALPGKFTVDMEGKQVFFSKGNLQATWQSSTGSYSWGFAANQYDIVGDAPGNTTIGKQGEGSVVTL
ncbi:MAG: hypothetical protein KBS65_02705, partial [Prevotella sp.]|nr:hypothetical protein [Candidatus Equicola stercoris]